MEVNRNGTIAFFCGRMNINTPARINITAPAGLITVSATPPPNLKCSGTTIHSVSLIASWTDTRSPAVRHQTYTPRTDDLRQESRQTIQQPAQFIWSTFKEDRQSLRPRIL